VMPLEGVGCFAAAFAVLGGAVGDLVPDVGWESGHLHPTQGVGTLGV